MAPGHWLDTARDPDQWGQLKDHVGSFIEYGCGDEDGRPQGNAILCVAQRSPADEHGRSITGVHIAASDPYYQWYADPRNIGKKGARETNLYHLCRGAAVDCQANDHGEDVVHVDVCRELGYGDVLDRMRKWRSLGTDFPGVPEDLVPSENPERDEERPRESRGRHQHRNDEDERRRHHKKESRPQRRRDGDSSGCSRSPKKSSRSPRRRRPERDGRPGNEERALDKELRGLLPTGPAGSSGAAPGALQEKLQKLKKRLGGGEPEGREQPER